MKTLSAATLTHLNSETTTFATFWKITRKDSTVQGFTSHSDDVYSAVDGITFKAASGVIPSNVATSTGRGVDNLQILGLISSPDITETAILTGAYDDARLEVFLWNYADLTNDKIMLVKGFIGEVRLGRKQFEAEVRSLFQRAQQVIGKPCSPLCRVKVLGDSECTKNLSTFTFTGQSVSAVVSRSQFRSTSAGVIGKAAFYFAYGVLTWTTGANTGKAVEVRNHDTNNPMLFILSEIMPYSISVGDQFTIVAGCDRRLETCRDKFSNVLNFRGEPFIPGADTVLRKVSQ